MGCESHFRRSGGGLPRQKKCAGWWQAFLANARQPALLEAGRGTAAPRRGNFALECAARASRCRPGTARAT